jgi:hypothetical protein
MLVRSVIVEDCMDRLAGGDFSLDDARRQSGYPLPIRALPRWPRDVAGGTPNVGLNEVNRFLRLASGILTEYLSRMVPISAKPNIPRDRASKNSPPTNTGL